MLIHRFMRVFFGLLYHPFAFTYDLVASTVSLGRWIDWVLTVIPFMEGERILELGHGPGHLQRVLHNHRVASVGLDESAPMGRLAKTRLIKSGYRNINLTCGVSQALPFADNTFDTIVSTFPSEYIFDPRTLTEAKRCLVNGGRLVVLPVAWHIGRKMIERFFAWVFRVTGETPGPLEIISKRLRAPFDEAGFQVDLKTVEVKSSLLLIIIANKKVD